MVTCRPSIFSFLPPFFLSFRRLAITRVYCEYLLFDGRDDSVSVCDMTVLGYINYTLRVWLLNEYV